MRSVIAGTGRFLPEKVLTNSDLEKMVDTSNQWIIERTGIRERHIADDNMCASDLAAPAALAALEKAGVKPEEIDLIIVGTSTPDMMFPSTACFVQAKIGAVNAAAFDILAACSGFIFGLTTADKYIVSGMYKKVLVIGSEVYSGIVDWEDRTTCVLFGDGAGAAVLVADDSADGSGILSAHIYSDGTKSDYLSAVGGGSYARFTPELISEKGYKVNMHGSRTFKVAIKMMTEAAQTALNHNGVKAEDIKLVIPHQANKRIIDMVAKQLGLDPSLFFMNLERYGNTAAASIPIALDEAIEQGKVEKGDLVLTVAFGGGFTWGSALIRL